MKIFDNDPTQDEMVGLPSHLEEPCVKHVISFFVCVRGSNTLSPLLSLMPRESEVM